MHSSRNLLTFEGSLRPTDDDPSDDKPELHLPLSWSMSVQLPNIVIHRLISFLSQSSPF